MFMRLSLLRNHVHRIIIFLGIYLLAVLITLPACASLHFTPEISYFME